MRIAQISPLFERVPPPQYGGTERVVSWITEALVGQGHEVTLFASGDSATSASLHPVTKSSLRSLGIGAEDYGSHFLLQEQVFQRADEFDIIHSHVEALCYPVARRTKTPVISTLHGRLDLLTCKLLYEEFSEVQLTSISQTQRKPMPDLNWIGNVYHGLPRDLFQLGEGKGKYLVHLGRISPEKGTDLAIDIAERVGMKLIVAGKVDRADQEYFDEVVKPKIDRSKLVEYIGEVGDDEKNDLLGSALAMIFPITVAEPFGLVMIEAMACGAPVIAFPKGSVTEVLDHGITGLFCSTVEEAVKSVERAARMDRSICRRAFEERFVVERMVEEYVRIYEKISDRDTVLPLAYEPAYST